MVTENFTGLPREILAAPAEEVKKKGASTIQLVSKTKSLKYHYIMS